MKLLSELFRTQRQKEGKTLAEYQRELQVELAKKQFLKLREMGLTIPVQLT